MDERLIERIKADMRYEFARTAPPEGFPAFHDIPTGRHTSDDFWELEQDHLWTDTWVIAGRVEDVANPGDYFTFSDLGVPLLIVRGTDGGDPLLLQHLPAPRRPGGPRDPRVGSAAALPVPLVDLRGRRRRRS